MNPYNESSIVSEPDHCRKRTIDRAVGHRDDPGRGVDEGLRRGPAVPARVHHRRPLRHRVQRAEGVLVRHRQRQREHVHAVVDCVIDGRKHAGAGTHEPFAASPDDLVHGEAGAGSSAARGPFGQAVEAGAGHDGADGDGGGEGAVADEVARREEVLLDVVGVDAGGVVAGADDLAAAVGRPEGLADLAYTFPP